MRPAQGHRFIVADLDHSQLRIAAGLSGDDALCLALAPGMDPHLTTGITVGGEPSDPSTRKLGKILNWHLLFLAGVRSVVEACSAAGLSLSDGSATELRSRWRTGYPALARWQDDNGGRSHFESPLGRRVTVPEERGAPAVLAGILQAAEADALRLVFAGSEDLEWSTGARIVLAIHDEVVWEVPEETIAEALGRARSLMLDAQASVCLGCATSVTVEIRTSWASGSHQHGGR